MKQLQFIFLFLLSTTLLHAQGFDINNFTHKNGKVAHRLKVGVVGVNPAKLPENYRLYYQYLDNAGVEIASGNTTIGNSYLPASEIANIVSLISSAEGTITALRINYWDINTNRVNYSFVRSNILHNTTRTFETGISNAVKADLKNFVFDALHVSAEGELPPVNATYPIVTAPVKRIADSVTAYGKMFTEYLKEMGLTMPVKTTGSIGQEGVTIGLVDKSNFSPVDTFSQGAFRIISTATSVSIFAFHYRGLRHGIFRYLYLLGYRRYFPHPDWAIRPNITTVFKPGLNITHNGSYIQRRLFYGHAHGISVNAHDKWHTAWSSKTFWEWAHPNFYDEGQQVTGHAYDGIIIRNEAYFIAHPEYINDTSNAEGGGYVRDDYDWRMIADGDANSKPTDPKFDLGHPDGTIHEELMQFIIEDYLKRIRAEVALNGEEPYMLNCDPSDGFGYEPNALSPLGDPTNQAFYVANRVAKAIRLAGYKTLVGILSYGAHVLPPTFALEPNIFVAVATSYNNTNYTTEQLGQLFTTAGAGVAFRGYASDYNWDRDMPGNPLIANYQAVETVRNYFYRNGVRYYVTETEAGWVTRGLHQWLLMQVMFDATADLEALKTEFFNNCFKKAANKMRALYDDWETYSVSVPRDGDVLGWIKMIDEAEALENDPAVVTRLDHYRMHFHQIMLWKHAFPAIQYNAIVKNYQIQTGWNTNGTPKIETRIEWKDTAKHIGMDWILKWTTWCYRTQKKFASASYQMLSNHTRFNVPYNMKFYDYHAWKDTLLEQSWEKIGSHKTDPNKASDISGYDTTFTMALWKYDTTTPTHSELLTLLQTHKDTIDPTKVTERWNLPADFQVSTVPNPTKGTAMLNSGFPFAVVKIVDPTNAKLFVRSYGKPTEIRFYHYAPNRFRPPHYKDTIKTITIPSLLPNGTATTTATEINISDMPAGIYMIHLVSGGGTSVVEWAFQGKLGYGILATTMNPVNGNAAFPTVYFHVPPGKTEFKAYIQTKSYFTSPKGRKSSHHGTLVGPHSIGDQTIKVNADESGIWTLSDMENEFGLQGVVPIFSPSPSNYQLIPVY